MGFLSTKKGRKSEAIKNVGTLSVPYHDVTAFQAVLCQLHLLKETGQGFMRFDSLE